HSRYRTTPRLLPFGELLLDRFFERHSDPVRCTAMLDSGAFTNPILQPLLQSQANKRFRNMLLLFLGGHAYHLPPVLQCITLINDCQTVLNSVYFNRAIRLGPFLVVLEY